MTAPAILASRIAELARAAGLQEAIVILDNRGPGEGWSAEIREGAGTLQLELSRDGITATIKKPGRPAAEIDEPEHWGAFHPEEKKIGFYLRVFRADLDGRLGDRVYVPKKT